MSETCAIIAGSGSFPRHVAQEAKRQGLRVVAIGLQGWADPSLAREVDGYEEVPIGQLGRLIDRLNAHQARQVVMAGKVTKEILFDPRIQFDAEALSLLAQAKEFSVNSLLGAIGTRLAARGITLLDSSTFLRAQLCPTGMASQRAPTAQEEDDIRIGVQVARRLADVDVGQTVVVKRKVIVAVEALEGTDAAIARAHQLAHEQLVVVKMASPRQDMRFDLPIVGVRTIEVAAACGVTCVAVEAGKTLLLERDRLLAQANGAGICVVGVEGGESG